MKEIDNSIEEFMTLFNKMFSDTKYNLQALNKRVESMDICFNNIMLLKSDKPFDERENEQKSKLNSNEDKNINLKITSKELDEIERMFREMYEPKMHKNIYIKKKRYNKKNNIRINGKVNNPISKMKKKYNNKNEDEGSLITDYLKPEKKIEKYTKFKEMKNNLMNIKNVKNNQNSDDEYEIDDDLDFDMEY